MTAIPLRRLSELDPGDFSDLFALLSAKDAGTTRDGKPYFRLTFRDPGRTATVMVWHDADWFGVCQSTWKVGDFFKIRGRLIENKYGLQLDVEQIRAATDDDRHDGFEPAGFYAASRYEPEAMFDALVALAESHIEQPELRQLVRNILGEYREPLLALPAATRNHHAFRGGFLEHVLSVTSTAVYLADKYCAEYPQLEPPLSKSLVVAGAILHDIGKLQELSAGPAGADYTPKGRLIGHILLGRDLVRDAARDIDNFPPEVLLRLEHIIVSHQNLPEWGSPVSPLTPEALLVHYADDIDAKFQMMAAALSEPPLDGAPFTGKQNPLRRTIFRGLPAEAAADQ